MIIRQQPVLANSRLTIAMAAMMGYCNDTDCAQCPYSVKNEAQVMCNFSAQHMHSAFATIKATGIATPLDAAQRSRARKNQEKKTTSLSIRVDLADKQRIAEISALTGVGTSQLFRDFVKQTYDVVRRRSNSERDKWNDKYFAGWGDSDGGNGSMEEEAEADSGAD